MSQSRFLNYSVCTPDEVHCTKYPLIHTPVIDDYAPLSLTAVLGKRLRSKRRACPLAISSNQLASYDFFLQLFVNPIGLFAFQTMRRSPAWRTRGYSVMKEVSESGALGVFFPERSSFTAENLSARGHVMLIEVTFLLTFSEP